MSSEPFQEPTSLPSLSTPSLGNFTDLGLQTPTMRGLHSDLRLQPRTRESQTYLSTCLDFTWMSNSHFLLNLAALP